MYYFSQFCRLCVRTDQNLINLFCVDENLLTLGDKMRALLPDIEDEDSIPNLVCHDCCTNIKKMFEFRKTCLKNNDILKLYTTKLLNSKQNPNNKTIENELKLLEKQIADENSDINLSLIFIQESKPIKDESDLKANEGTDSVVVKDEPIEQEVNSETEQNNDSEPEQEFDETVMNKFDVTKTYTRKTVIDIVQTKVNDSFEPDLKLECTEEDDDSFSEDQTEEHGDESMDYDEVISVNDSENEIDERNIEDMINLPEPINLTTSLNNPNSLDSRTIILPPHLASGNRGNASLKSMPYDTLYQYYVCAKHFAPSSFRNVERRRLNYNAVPMPLIIKLNPNITDHRSELSKYEPPEPELDREIENTEIRPVKRPIFTYSRQKKTRFELENEFRLLKD